MLEIDKRVLGEDHPVTMTGMNNLANLYSNQGRYAEAEPLFVKALDGYRRVMGGEHPETLNTMNNLAVAYGFEEQIREGRTAVRSSGRAPEPHFGCRAPRRAERHEQPGHALWVRRPIR